MLHKVIHTWKINEIVLHENQKPRLPTINTFEKFFKSFQEKKKIHTNIYLF